MKPERGKTDGVSLSGKGTVRKDRNGGAGMPPVRRVEDVTETITSGYNCRFNRKRQCHETGRARATLRFRVWTVMTRFGLNAGLGD